MGIFFLVIPSSKIFYCVEITKKIYIYIIILKSVKPDIWNNSLIFFMYLFI